MAPTIISALITAASAAFGKVKELISEKMPDTDLANEITKEIDEIFLEFQTKLLDVQQNIIITEMQGNWLQRSWRPILMLTIVAIVFNNYLLSPYIQMIFGTSLQLELPARLWDLMTVGVGGYVIGRTVERSIEKYRQNPPIVNS